MKRITILLCLMVACALSVVADDQGHHHEDLTQSQLGTVHFPVSCSASVQKPFERGVALLHSFWYEEAEKDFAQVAADDPKCAMAHWGIAMSIWHQLWNHPDETTVAKGLSEANKAKELSPATGREAGYLAAIQAFYGGAKDRDYLDRAKAYCEAMRALHTKQPNDREAAAFYALSLLASEPEKDTTFVNRKEAAAVLEKLFSVEPNHPGVAHYLIHSYDKPQLAELGLPAARRYAKIAPSAPHALHMPSHIFARLGLWQDDIDSNLASIAATRRTAAMHMGGEGHQFHAMDFLHYAYLQSGREADAQRLVDEAKAMAPVHDMYDMGFDPRISFIAGSTADTALELHHWSEAAALAPIEGAGLGDQSATYCARAVGAARSGNAADARKALTEIAAIKKKADELKKNNLRDPIEHDEKEAAAWVSYVEGHQEDGLSVLRSLAEKEEAVGDEPWWIPAREMLADMLLDMHQPERALAEYEMDLKFNPNRFDGLYGAAHAAEMAGKTDKQNSYYAQLIKVCAGSHSDRTELSHAKQLLAAK